MATIASGAATRDAALASRRPWLWAVVALAAAALPAGSCGGSNSTGSCGFASSDLSGTWAGDHTLTHPDQTSVQGTEATTFLEKAGGSDVKGFWTYTRGDSSSTLFLDGSCSGKNQTLRSCSMHLGIPVTDVLSLDSTDGCAIAGSGTTTDASVLNVSMNKQSDPPSCPNDVNMELDGVWVGNHEFTGGATGREYVQIDDAGCDQIHGVWVFDRNNQLVQNDFTGHCTSGRGNYVIQVGTETLALSLVPDQCVLSGSGTNTSTGETYTLHMARGSRSIS
jgi:hypothetical protein